MSMSMSMSKSSSFSMSISMNESMSMSISMSMNMSMNMSIRMSIRIRRSMRMSVNRRLGVRIQPGNRFVSCRACGRGEASWEREGGSISDARARGPKMTCSPAPPASPPGSALRRIRL